MTPTTPPSPGPPQGRPPRLQELATWTSDWREAWGRRANELNEQGVPWPEHEVRAFDEVRELKAKGGRAPKPRPPAGEPPTKAVKVTTEKAGKLNLGETR
jgi:hypothetical protein